MEQEVSIKDIAKQCGVSVATVSRVINKNGRYSKETEEKVLNAIREAHYVQNQIARSLRARKTKNVGIIVPDITNEFFVKVVYALEKNLFQAGYQAYLCNTDEDPEIEKVKIDMMTSNKVCGLIFLASGADFPESKVGNLPVVMIDRIPKKLRKNYSIVSSDNVQGGYLAAKELIGQGCRKPMIMTSRMPLSGYTERLEGYEKALKEAGFLKKEGVHAVYLDRLHYQEAYDEMDRMIKAGEYDYDGIFAASDWLALGCYRALTDNGYRVPEQVKIAGYDDISITAFNTVPLTTVHQQVDEIGRLAVEQLLKALNGEEAPAEPILVPVSLDPRESTRGVKKNAETA